MAIWNEFHDKHKEKQKLFFGIFKQSNEEEDTN